MRKTLRVIGATLAVLLTAAIAVPTLCADQVGDFAKKLLNDNVKDATVDIGGFGLSIFSSFPSLTAGLEDVSIVGKGRFEGDTLLHLGRLYADLDLMKAIGGEIQVNAVRVNDVLVQGIVTADSIANWDIFAMAADSAAVEEAPADTTASELHLNINEVSLNNIRLAYIDSTASISASVDGINAAMSGAMNGNVMDMDLTLGIDAIGATVGGVKLLSDATLDFNAKAKADLDSMKFEFDKNRLTFAGLPLAFDGWVQMVDSTTFGMDIRLAALETAFQTVIDLIPESALKSVEGLQTKGSFALYAKAKGIYRDMDNLPEFVAALKVNDGYIKYPDLPKDLSAINVSVLAKNPGGSADLTTVAVDTFHFALGGNPFDLTANVSTPISNLTFDAQMLGKLDLGSLAQALPLDSMEIAGHMDADLKVAGDMASLDNGQYDKISAMGHVGLKSFKFEGTALPQGLNVPEALLTFSPKSVNLNPLSVIIGKSDISMTGIVEDYLPYVMRGSTVTGAVTVNSKLLDCNELLSLAGEPAPAPAEESEEIAPAASQPTAAEPIKLPKNINFKFSTDIEQLLYDKLTLSNINGRIALADGVADLSNLSTDICDGKLVLNGKFQTPEKANAKVDMKMDFVDVNINKLTGSFSVVDSVLPIAHNAHGVVGIGLNIAAEMDETLSLVMKSVNGNGSFASKDIQLKDSDFQKKLSALMKKDKYNDIRLKNCKTAFTIENGNVIVTPFDVDVFGHASTFGGRQGLDQTMDYALKMPVDRSEITELLSKAGVSLGSTFASGGPLPVSVTIGGSLTKPEVKLDLKEATAIVAKEAAAKAKDKASSAIDKAVDNIKDEKAKEAVSNARDALNNIFKKKK